VSKFGRLDIMVNNAGIETRTSVLDTTEAQYDKVMASISRARSSERRSQPADDQAGGGGRIINITSVHEDWPMPGNTAYCLAKGGMRMLTRTAGSNWRVTTSSLSVSVRRGGDADQPQHDGRSRPSSRSWTLPSRWAAWRGRRRLPAWWRFLAGDGASYLTATTIFADGGIMHSSVGL
jgi:glucose 1-dehydrogenase